MQWSIHPWELAGAAVLPAGIEPRDAVLVVVSICEERDALPLVVERFDRTGLELLIVDDNSPDGTGGLADALAVQRPWMHVCTARRRTASDGLPSGLRPMSRRRL